MFLFSFGSKCSLSYAFDRLTAAAFVVPQLCIVLCLCFRNSYKLKLQFRLQPCAGLGDDSGRALAASAFDVRQPVRAYGATRDGQLLWLSLGHAKTFQNCQVCSNHLWRW